MYNYLFFAVLSFSLPVFASLGRHNHDFWNIIMAAALLGLIIMFIPKFISAMWCFIHEDEKKTRLSKVKISIAILSMLWMFVYNSLFERMNGFLNLVYILLGIAMIFIHNRYKKASLQFINYVVITYEFFVLLFISNKDWMYGLKLGYKHKLVFVFLILSIPTLLWGVYKYTKLDKSRKDK